MPDKLTDILQNNEHIVFFGGAGVSTESGLPDFRSPDGLYQAMREFERPPEELLSHAFFEEHPETFFDYYVHNLINTNVKPNAAHLALAKLEEMGKLKAVVTQNIDGLHQQAGSKTVHELHGSVYRNYCTACGTEYTLDYMLNPEKQKNNVPRCEKCSGIVRPDVVLYGEFLDDNVMKAAADAIAHADALIVGGTSLVVYPAAGLLEHFGGKTLVLINKGSTPYDNRAGLVIHDSVGKVLGEAAEALG